MDFNLIIPAFIAGILTFIAPCTLPLVPGYLGFISGTSLHELNDPGKAKAARKKIFLNGLFFIIGFTIVFMALGTVAGFAGNLLGPYRLWLNRIGGVFVIMFGLFMLGVFRLPFLARARELKAPSIFERGKLVNSLVFGSAFGLGWTPCVGPVLGSILLLASTTSTVFQGTLLLFVFSMGLAVPFLLVALGIGSASRYIAKISKYLKIVSIVGGVFIIFLGILIFTNKMAFWISYGYRLFRFINYDRLLDYL